MVSTVRGSCIGRACQISPSSDVFAVMQSKAKHGAEPFVAHFPTKGLPTLLLYQLHPGASVLRLGIFNCSDIKRMQLQ
jgi:hypothetical protein